MSEHAPDYYAPLGTATVIRADARAIPLPDNSVDLVVTSPPYYALRSYQDGGVHYDGQIGSEATPAEFVDALLEVTRECMRVLKPSGSLWVNLGDKYVADNRGSGVDIKRGEAKHAPRGPLGYITGGMRQKSLMGIPWRYALACIDDLGLILRAEVIWSKPNGLPESVTDRVRRSHEQWFYFEQSGGVEPLAEGLPLCDLCGRPVDARATLVARLKEVDGGAEPVCVPDHMRQDGGGKSPDASRGHHDMAVGPLVPAVPSVGVADAQFVEQSVELVEDLVGAAVDSDSENGTARRTSDEADRALAVDESSEPAGVCECERHALTLNDEPWIPQSLAAELMQMVADGTADPQNVADFLSGDYARTHSTWFHFTLEPRYFSAVDEIREAHTSGAHGAARSTRTDRRADEAARFTTGTTRGLPGQPGSETAFHALGKLPGSVWVIPTEPLKVPDHLGVDHFAAFPTEWPKRIIQGWSPAGICTACGEGRRPVIVKDANGKDRGGPQARHVIGYQAVQRSDWAEGVTTTITGYSCACPEPTAPTRPAVVLDPFGGTGTTAMVAKALGRHGISVDMSADYCRLAQWRTNDRNQLAKVLGIAKAPDMDPHQLHLFTEVIG